MRGFVWDWAYRSDPAQPEQAPIDFSREPMVGAGASRPAAPRQVGRCHFRVVTQARSHRSRANLSPTLGEDENKIERVQRGEIYADIVGCNHRDNSRSCRHKRLCCRTGPRAQWGKWASCGKQCVDNSTWLRRRQQAWLGWRKRGRATWLGSWNEAR